MVETAVGHRGGGSSRKFHRWFERGGRGLQPDGAPPPQQMLGWQWEVSWNENKGALSITSISYGWCFSASLFHLRSLFVVHCSSKFVSVCTVESFCFLGFPLTWPAVGNQESAAIDQLLNTHRALLLDGGPTFPNTWEPEQSIIQGGLVRCNSWAMKQPGKVWWYFWLSLKQVQECFLYI